MSRLKFEDAANAGYFDLELALVPASWFRSQDEPIELSPDDYRMPPVIWWSGDTSSDPVCSFCDLNFENSGPSVSYMQTDLIEDGWVDSEGHRIDLVMSPSGYVSDLYAIIDIRQPCSGFIDKLIALALKVDCLFFEFGDGLFFEPSRAPILRAVETHTMAHVSVDNAGRLLPH